MVFQLIYNSKRNQKKGFQKEQNNIQLSNSDYLFILVTFFAFGSVFTSPQIFMRYAMLISYILIPITTDIVPEKRKLRVQFQDFGFIVFFIASIAYQYVAMTAHGVTIE